MNLEPAAEFDPSEELAHFHDPEQKLFGLSERVYFYLIVTCKAIESFAEPSFTIDAVFGPPKLTPTGCFVEFVVREHVFWIDVSHERAKLWAALADDADGIRNRYLVHDGAADNPAAWEGLLQAIGRVEKFGVIVNHADRLRQMWSGWLVEQKRRGDERGW